MHPQAGIGGDDLPDTVLAMKKLIQMYFWQSGEPTPKRQLYTSKVPPLVEITAPVTFLSFIQ